MIPAPVNRPSYRLELINQASPELREAVNVELRRHNRAANPAWHAARELPANDAQPLHLFAFAADGQVCGGLFAETQFLWLKVSILAVCECCRGQGLGSRLLREGERVALERGCQFAFLDTMEYQAPAFYERRGYQQVGRLPNWDSHGHAKLFYMKVISSEPTATVLNSVSEA